MFPVKNGATALAFSLTWSSGDLPVSVSLSREAPDGLVGGLTPYRSVTTIRSSLFAAKEPPVGTHSFRLRDGSVGGLTP